HPPDAAPDPRFPPNPSCPRGGAENRSIMNTAPLSLLRDFSDRLSPMVVKELRHGLRTRVFTSILTFFQFCMILIVGSGVLGVDMEVVNNLFWGISLVALLAILPLRGFSTLS